MDQSRQKMKHSEKGSAKVIAVAAAVFLIGGAIILGIVLARRDSGSEETINESQPPQIGDNLPKTDLDQVPVVEEPKAGSMLSFDQSKKTVAIDEKFSLRSMIDPKGKKIGATELRITFDPKALKLESVIPSEVFSLALSGPKIDNEKGTASIVLGVPLEKESAGSISPVATFNFQALGAVEKTEVIFTDKSGAAADGESSNVITSMESATIQVR